MIQLSELWLAELTRATLVLCVAVLLGKSVLRFTRAAPQTRVVTWMLILLPCWLLFSFALELPWLEGSQEPKIATKIVSSSPLQSTVSTFDQSINFATGRFQLSQFPLSGLMSVLLLVTWVSGIVILVAKYSNAYFRMQRLLTKIAEETRSSQLFPITWRNEFENAKRDIGLHKDVQLLISDKLSPMLSWFEGRSVIVVPETFWKESTPQQRSAILLHELAHAKRFDVWSILIARILMLPQWFNPFAWYAMRQLSGSIEMACDDDVLKHSEFDRFEYAKSLLSLVEFQQNEISFGLSASGPPVSQRIRRLVHPNGVEMKFTKTIAIGSLVLVSLFGFVRPELVAQNSDTEKSSDQIEKVQPQVKTDPVGEGKNLNDTDTLIVRSYPVYDLVRPLKNDNTVLGGVTLHDFLPLKNMITHSIVPDEWDGRKTFVRPNPKNQNLVVRQKLRVHKEIEGVLRKLREMSRFNIELNSFVVLIPKDSQLLPAKISETGNSIDVEVVKKIRDAQKEQAVECIQIPGVHVLNGQTVVYENFDEDLWSIKGMSCSMLMNASRKNIILQLSKLAKFPSSVPKVPDDVYGVVTRTDWPQVLNEKEAEDFKQLETGSAGVFAQPIGDLVCVVAIEDGKFFALDVSAMLKTEKQHRRAVLIVNAEIKDSQHSGVK